LYRKLEGGIEMKNKAYHTRRINAFEKILCDMTTQDWDSSYTGSIIRRLEIYLPLISDRRMEHNTDHTCCGGQHNTCDNCDEVI
tara:strand:+ start:14 stop:265 length:252 start_codon:yes stop_codon:yes gene_type:complete